MSGQSQGLIDWRMSRNQDGHRDYHAKFLVLTTDTLDGPETVLNAVGLPAIGATWGYGNDNDPWAFCWPECTITPVVENPGTVDFWWYVEYLFTTRPIQRCQLTTIQSPITEPQKVGGSFVSYTREADVDAYGNPILNSSFERIRGQAVERDFNKPYVFITTNFPFLPLTLYAQFMNTVNDAPLWGLNARCIKLARVIWERQLYGVCTFYYPVTYEFDIDFDTFDRPLKDEGTLVLAPGGDPTNPSHYIPYKAVTGDLAKVQLNGAGRPATSAADQGTINVQLYTASNFLLLGVPVSF